MILSSGVPILQNKKLDVNYIEYRLPEREIDRSISEDGSRVAVLVRFERTNWGVKVFAGACGLPTEEPKK